MTITKIAVYPLKLHINKHFNQSFAIIYFWYFVAVFFGILISLTNALRKLMVIVLKLPMTNVTMMTRGKPLCKIKCWYWLPSSSFLFISLCSALLSIKKIWGGRQRRFPKMGSKKNESRSKSDSPNVKWTKNTHIDKIHIRCSLPRFLPPKNPEQLKIKMIVIIIAHVLQSRLCFVYPTNINSLGISNQTLKILCFGWIEGCSVLAIFQTFPILWNLNCVLEKAW